jgi:tetratricopeptide (TPR) repeat protein
MTARRRLRRATGAAAALSLLAALARAEPPAGAAPAAEALLQRGRAALEDSLFALAETNFAQAVGATDDPVLQARAMLGVSQARLAAGRPAEAADQLRPLATRPLPADLRRDVLYALATAQTQAGLSPEALATLQAAFRETAGEPEDRFVLLLARALRAAGLRDEAAAVLDGLSARTPREDLAAAARLEQADLLAEGGDRAGAVAALDRLVALAPGRPEALEARLRQGLWLTRDGETARAVAILQPIAEDATADAGVRGRAWLALAAAREAQSDRAGALDALDRAEAASPAADLRARARISRARLLLDADDFDRVRALLREALRDDPQNPDAEATHLRLARRLMEAGRIEDAAQAFQEHVETFQGEPGRGAALLGRGWCLWRLQRYPEAASEFHRAAQTAGAGADVREEALFKCADAYFAAGQYALALETYDAHRRLHPDSASRDAAALQAAECLARLGRPGDALARFERLRDEARPDDPLAGTAAIRAVQMLEESGRWTDALAAATRLIESGAVGDIRARALLGRGLIAYRMGAFDAALADFDGVAREFADNAALEHALFMRGWCLYLMGRDDEALAVCRRFVAEHPASPWAPGVQFWLGEYHFNRGAFAEAEESFATLADRFAESELADRALYWAGRAAAAGKQYLRAIEYFNRLAAQFPASARLAEARFAQGDALSELGQFAAALLAFDEVIRNHAGSYLADAAWGRKGDCHFTLASEDAARYEQALACYRAVLDRPTASTDQKLQARYKIGRALEKRQQPDEAFAQYMDVVYGHLQARERGEAGSPMWFTRAAFSAAELQERRGEWREAVGVYRRVVEAGGAAAEEAQDRIRRIRLDRWRLF